MIYYVNDSFLFFFLHILMTSILFQISSSSPHLITSSPHHLIMPRKYVPKGVLQTDRTALEEAFNHRVNTGCSIRDACKAYGVKVMTLQVSLFEFYVFFLF